MIEMSLDRETVLSPDRTAIRPPVKASPAFPAPVGLSEQPKVVGGNGKTRPLRPKNGVQLQAPPSGPPPQRMAKRRYTVGGSGLKGPANKRRRRVNSDSQSAEPVLPSHFLLGGNIFDPLNLNSLLDDEVNRATNQETPQCSPLPLRGGDPVEILLPRDRSDPLSLSQPGEPLSLGGAARGGLYRSRRRHRHRGGGDRAGRGGVKEAAAASVFAVPHVSREGSAPPSSPLSCELNTSINCREDVVPPILPRRHTHPPAAGGHAHNNNNNNNKARNHGDQRRRRRTTSAARSSLGSASCDTPSAVRAPPPTARFHTPLVGGAEHRCGAALPDSSSSSSQTPTKKKTKDRARYQHGNHSRYYGYHGCYGAAAPPGEEGPRVGAAQDPRLRLLKADWFRDKRVLDVGCGAGHVTLGVARHLGPAHVTGVELDGRLVRAANRNVRHFLSHDLAVAARERRGLRDDEEEEGRGHQEVVVKTTTGGAGFPLSFRVGRGPLAAPPLRLHDDHHGFPGNVCFIMGDYVSEQEAWPGQGQYDVIMCLGVTKWVQLQSGDGGVVRLFKRAYQSLSPGGMFILEAQPWSSYARSKNLTATTRHNYRSVRLKPDTFSCYLIRSVGYTSYTLLHTGDQRPIYIFHKGSASRK